MTPSRPIRLSKRPATFQNPDTLESQKSECASSRWVFNAYGYPLCPADDSLPMKSIGLCHEKGRSDRIKWGCPKIHIVKGDIICDCESPCSPAKFGRTTYTYNHQDFRMFPEIQRDSDQWKNLCKIRCNIERSINHFIILTCVLPTCLQSFLPHVSVSQNTSIVLTRMTFNNFKLIVRINAYTAM